MNLLLQSFTLSYKTRCTQVKHAEIFYVKQNEKEQREKSFQSKVTGREASLSQPVKHKAIKHIEAV